MFPGGRVQMGDWLIFLSGVLLAAVIPEIAVGASIGSLFFMLVSENEKGFRKLLLLIIGWFVGYFIAIPFTDSGWGGIIAVMGSAFAVVLMLEVFVNLEQGEREMPAPVHWILDLLSKIRGR